MLVQTAARALAGSRVGQGPLSEVVLLVNTEEDKDQKRNDLCRQDTTVKAEVNSTEADISAKNEDWSVSDEELRVIFMNINIPHDNWTNVQGTKVLERQQSMDITTRGDTLAEACGYG